MGFIYDHIGKITVMFIVLILGGVLAYAIANDTRGPHRYGLQLSECVSWCSRSGVERWNRSEARTHTSYSGGKKHSFTTYEPYCECVGVAGGEEGGGSL